MFPIHPSHNIAKALRDLDRIGREANDHNVKTRRAVRRLFDLIENVQLDIHGIKTLDKEEWMEEANQALDRAHALFFKLED